MTPAPLSASDYRPLHLWALWLGGGLIGAALVTSLFFEGYADIIYAPATLLLYGGCLCLTIPAFKAGFRVPSAPSALLFLLFCAYITTSVWWSTVPFSSLITFLVFSSLPVTFLAVTTLIADHRAIEGLLTATVVTLAILGGWAVAQYTVFSDIYGSRAHHPLPNANNLASLLNLGLVPALAYTLSRPVKTRGFAAGLLVSSLLFSGLLATGSRGGFLIFIGAFITLAFIIRSSIKTHKYTAGLCCLAGVILFIIFQVAGGDPVAARLEHLGQPLTDKSTLARLSLWEQSLKMLADYGISGTGLGTFHFYYPPYREALIDNSAGFWVHMDPLQFGIETGVTAILLFYAALTAILLRMVRVFRALPPESKDRRVIGGLFCGLLTVAIHTHISFPLYLMPILIVCGLWWGALYMYSSAYTSRPDFKTGPSDGPARILTLTTVLIICGVLSLMTVSSAAGQYYLLTAIDNIKQGRVSGFINNIEKAQQWGPASFIDPQVQLVGFYIDLFENNATMLFSQDEQTELKATGLKILSDAETLNPVWAEIDYKRGRLYEVTGTPALARDAWQTALDKNPLHHKSRLALARNMVSAGQPADAYDLLQTGLSYPLPPHIKETHKTLINAVEDLATIQKAYKLRKQVTDHDNRDKID